MSKIKVNNLETHTGDDITVHDNMHVLSSNLSADGNVHVGGNLNVVGTATISGGTVQLGDAANDNIIFGAEIQSHILPDSTDTYNLGASDSRWNEAHVKTLDTHNQTIDNNLTVGNDTDIAGDIDITGTAVVSGTGTIHGAVDLKSTLAVGGSASITGNTDIGGNATVTGNADVTGTLSVTSSAHVTGNIKTSSNLTVGDIGLTSGTATIGDSLTVGGSADVQSSLNVDGISTLRKGAIITPMDSGYPGYSIYSPTGNASLSSVEGKDADFTSLDVIDNTVNTVDGPVGAKSTFGNKSASVTVAGANYTGSLSYANSSINGEYNFRSSNPELEQWYLGSGSYSATASYIQRATIISSAVPSLSSGEKRFIIVYQDASTGGGIFAYYTTQDVSSPGQVTQWYDWFSAVPAATGSDGFDTSGLTTVGSAPTEIDGDGNISSTKKVTAGTLEVTGNGTVDGTLVVDGHASFNDSASVNQAFTVNCSSTDVTPSVGNSTSFDEGISVQSTFGWLLDGPITRIYDGNVHTKNIHAGASNRATRQNFPAGQYTFVNEEKSWLKGEVKIDGVTTGTTIKGATISATNMLADTITIKNESLVFDSGSKLTSDSNTNMIVNNGTGGSLIQPCLSTATLTADLFNGSSTQWLSSDGVSGYAIIRDFVAQDGAVLRSTNNAAPVLLAAAPVITYDAQQTVSIDPLTSSVDEGLTATATITRSATAGVVDVYYYTSDGTATGGSDYTTAASTLTTFAAGVSSISVSVPTNTDGIFTEADSETFNIHISGASKSSGPVTMVQPVVNASASAHVVTINDLDLYPDQSVQFTLSSQNIAEPASGSSVGSVEVTRTGDNPGYGTVYVNYVVTASGGTAGVYDFSPAAGTVTFSSTVTAQTINFTVSSDDVSDDGETFEVLLQSPPTTITEHVTANVGSTYSTHVVTITGG
jgi:hypothetical protein